MSVSNEDAMSQLSDLLQARAAALGVHLHAFVLVGTGGTMLMEGATSRDHAEAIAQQLEQAAERARRARL